MPQNKDNPYKNDMSGMKPKGPSPEVKKWFADTASQRANPKSAADPNGHNPGKKNK